MKRPWLLPFTPLYAAGVRWKNAKFDQHPEQADKLKWPVVSVGSLSAGGAGKTPVVAALVALLRDAGYVPDILSRGYGRKTKETLRVDPQGSALKYGDEPLMLARSTGVPVYVAAERIRAGKLAEIQLDAWQQHVHLLDDGFQHRKLARNVNIVLLTLEDVNDHLLPAGNLREPLSSLKRADVIIVREEEQQSLAQAIANNARANTKIWIVRRQFVLPQITARPVAFCALARPKNFFEALQKHGTSPIATHQFQDHKQYDSAIISKMIRSAKSVGADGWVTTMKDAVKLDEEMLTNLRSIGSVAVADITADFVDAATVTQDLKAMLTHAENKSTRRG